MNLQTELGGRAIVIGASMAGLLAARVLSERFAQVWVVERDELLEGPARRKGTPHAEHAHALLVRGRQIIEEFFPGFSAAVLARGGLSGDSGSSVHLFVGGRELARKPVGQGGVVCSRPLIEDEVRRRVRALANVSFMTRVDVVEPIYDAAQQRVTGIRVRVHDGGSTVEDGTLAADLVVDCTGRGSRTPQWLSSIGFNAPEEERVANGVGYATAYFERKPSQFPECGEATVVISQATASRRFPAVMIAQEPLPGDSRARWVVTFGGFTGEHPEATLQGLEQRAEQGAVGMIERVVTENAMLGPVVRFGFPHSQWRRYEKLQRFPERFLVLGDAIASFNPIYGQGMSVAACQAVALRDALSHGLDGVYRPYFQAASKAIDTPWRLAVGADLSIPTVQGKRTRTQRAINRYLGALFRAAEHDAVLTQAFKRVTNLMAPPATLFRPGIVARVVMGNLLASPRPDEGLEFDR
jgi:2-polyprenyl-6-methoxyphenol hydroxylase-like FAD-dependent oxidoreductase